MNAQTQIATVTEAPRRSLLIDMAMRYGMEPKTFADTIRATVVPANTSNEEFAAFLMVAKQYELNPILKEIYAFPKRGGGIQPIVSIDGWANLINSHPKLNGIEFDDHIEKDGKTVSAITCRIWRKDRDKPIVVTEYLAECQRSTDTWKQYPRRMLRHKALIQCARYAFGFAGIVDPDEAERIGVDATRNNQRDEGPPAPPTMTQPLVREIAAPSSAASETVVWDENTERPATTADLDDIPPMLDRREKPKDAQGFDEAQWLRDLEGALSSCEDFTCVGEKQRDVMAPEKGKASPSGWKKAEKLVAAALDRINTILAAG